MNKVIRIFVTTLCLLIILSSTLFADTIKEMFDTAKDWENTGLNHTNQTMDTTELKATSDIIYNVFFGIGIAVAVIAGAILGIQFMTAGIDQKVQVKEALLPYVISCIVLFGAFGIWKLVVTILGGINL